MNRDSEVAKPEKAVWYRADRAPADYAIDHNAIIAAFPGPALAVAHGGEVIATNKDAERLSLALQAGEAEQLRLLAATITATRKPGVGHTMLAAGVCGPERAVYYLSGIPVAASEPRLTRRRSIRNMEGDLAVIFARDVSMDHAMRLALVESRDLYRDLARCSSDFAWQTDENGVFSFVSAKGALGYSAQALNGRSSLDLLDVSSGFPETVPFVTREHVEDIEIVMTSADGDRRYCIVDALPSFDREGTWRGARGVSRDVTEAKLRQQALDHMRAREENVRAIVDATHRTLDPHVAFAKAAKIIATSENSVQAAILAVNPGGSIEVLGAYRDGDAAAEQDGGAPGLPPESVIGRLHDFARNSGEDTVQRADIVSGKWQHRVTGTGHGGQVNGALWVTHADTIDTAYDTENSADTDGRPLADAIANHIGISIAHLNQLRQLESLSRTDELTGLLNRRAFMDDLHQRQVHRYRVSRPGALLYVDLDNFKPVNDTYGHDVGDAALRKLASLLTSTSRAGDLCARLGGDEFALWLEDTHADGAQDKAQILLSGMAELNNTLLPGGRVLDRPLGLSIGIAIADPSIEEALEQLIKRADEAMYHAKQGGKNRYVVAGLQTPPSISTHTESGD